MTTQTIIIGERGKNGNTADLELLGRNGVRLRIHLPISFVEFQSGLSIKMVSPGATPALCAIASPLADVYSSAAWLEHQRGQLDDGSEVRHDGNGRLGGLNYSVSSGGIDDGEMLG